MTILDPEGILDPDINGQLGDDGIVGCNWQVQGAVDVTRTSTSCPITVTYNGIDCFSYTYPGFAYIFEIIVNDAATCPLDTVTASAGTPTTTETTTSADTAAGRKRYRVSVASTAPDCTGVTVTATNDCADSASATGFNCSMCRNYLRFSIPAYTWNASVSVADNTPGPFPGGTVRPYYTSTSVSEEIVFGGGTVFFRTACNYVPFQETFIGTGTYTQSISGIVRLYFSNGAPPSIVDEGTYGAELSANINFYTTGSDIYFYFENDKVSYDSWWDDFGGVGYTPLTFSGLKCAKLTGPLIPGFPSTSVPPSTGCGRIGVVLAAPDPLEYTYTQPDFCGSTIVDYPMYLKSRFVPGFSPLRCIFKYGPMHGGVWNTYGDWSGSCDGGSPGSVTGVPVGSPCPCGSITGTKQYVTI